jgi:hypothetical protein
MTTIQLDYESTTKNYYRFGSKKDGYIITAYIPKAESDTKPNKVSLVTE